MAQVDAEDGHTVWCSQARRFENAPSPPRTRATRASASSSSDRTRSSLPNTAAASASSQTLTPSRRSLAINSSARAKAAYLSGVGHERDDEFISPYEL